jgi:hypothetical protein
MMARHPRTAGHGATPANNASDPQPGPFFAQPEPGPDPTKFLVRHPTDQEDYRQIDVLNREHRLRPLPFPAPRGGVEPVLNLAEILGPSGAAAEKAISAAGQLVFHAVGDTGNTRGPTPQNEVADKMLDDFTEADPRDRPKFFLHLGDVIYNFGEAQYYYDQFYDPYRGYPAPILALAGMVAPGGNAPSLGAFLENFCAEGFHIPRQAGGLSRTAQIQPGVFFTFQAPFLRVLALYSNTLEDPGVISSQNGTWPEVGDSQLDFVRAALQRVKDEKYHGALILAHHHPAFTAGSSKHGWSLELTAELDKICQEVGVWPHAVLSGHAHNYQRFTRLRGNTQMPYLIAGGGGHGLGRLARKGQPPLRTPSVVQPQSGDSDQVQLENYDDQGYGYLRLVASAKQLRIEYHPAGDGDTAKTPDDSVTIDLATRQLVHPRL